MTESKRIPFAETTSWSPSHLGRARALCEAHPGMVYEVETNKEGEAVRLDPSGDDPEEIYGSDLRAHLELLAARERARK